MLHDYGNWTVRSHKERIWLQSDEFIHDVALRIDGDFSSFDVKWEYAEKIAERLNNTKP